MTIREILLRFHRMVVGLSMLGACETGPDNLVPGTKIGRYSSVYYTVRTISRDSATDASLLPASVLGRTGTRAAPQTTLVIGNDVFIGHNAIVLSSAEEIGDGAVIGA